MSTSTDRPPAHPGTRNLPPPDSATALDYAKAWPQYLLPHHLLSRTMHGVARSRRPWVRRTLIRWFLHHFDVELAEAVETDPETFADFNSFFTRALRPGVRPLAGDAATVVSPVDGVISQCGTIDDATVFQAKGRRFDLAALLGGDTARAEPFRSGRFLTLYLSPRDYHRIHMPLDGTLREMVHVPGRLFSVNPATTRVVPRLFARNERVVAFFDTPAGPMALVLVGALFVGSIETVWAGEITPPTHRRVRRWRYDDRAQPVHFARGAEMGRFNMGSTVIVLLGAEGATLAEDLGAGRHLRFGEAIGRISRPADD